MSEKLVTIPKPNGYILHASLFHKDNNENLIIICHGGLGDRYEHGRFSYTANQLIEQGYNALLFDFSGFGQNERIPISISLLMSDLQDVWNWAKERYECLSTIGLSLGGFISLCTPLLNRKCAVFWSPAFDMKNTISPLQKILGKLWFVFTSTPLKMNHTGTGPRLLFGRDFMEEVLNFDIDRYLRNFTIPTLIIQGNKDTDVKLESTISAYEKFPKDGNHFLKIVEGAPHDFEGEHLDQYINHTASFLKEHL